MPIEEYLRKKYSAFSDSAPLFNIQYVIDETLYSDAVCRLSYRKMFGRVAQSFNKEMFIAVCTDLLQKE